MIARTLPSLHIVVLAAGFSTRLGTAKALATVRGATLLERTLRVLRPFAASRIIVVIPPRSGRYRLGADTGTLRFIANPNRAQGLSSSVRHGLHAARRAAGALLLPVDLVDLTARDVARLVARWRGARRTVAARASHGKAASPLILPRHLYASAMQIRGDQGLRDWVRRLPPRQVRLVAMPSAEPDVDTRAHLERARRRARLTP